MTLRTYRSPGVWLILLPVGLVACATPPAQEAADATSPASTGYRASGNEPFWHLTFGETTIDLSVLGRDELSRSAARPEPEAAGNGWRYRTAANGQPLTVRIEVRRCNDSMSGRPFPHTVSVTVGGETFKGCGGDTASLLTGNKWAVDELDGVPVPGSHPPTLLFASDGALTGTGGCNQFRSSYEITGEGIRIGAIRVTLRACADSAANERETRFLTLLQHVSRFDIAEDGSLLLFQGDTLVMKASR